MSNPSSDSYRNPLRHTGQDYSFAPRYLRPRDPFSPTNASRDIKPKENQGYYPLGSIWTNSTNGNLWILANITNNLAKWLLLTGTETGTFTPNITIGGSSVGITYAFQDGQYSKIGNVVNFWIRIILTSKGINTGAVQLIDLPFTIGALQYVPIGVFNGVTAANYTTLGMQLLSGTKTSNFIASDIKTANGTVNLSEANISDTFQIETNGIYFTV